MKAYKSHFFSRGARPRDYAALPQAKYKGINRNKKLSYTASIKDIWHRIS